MNLLDLKLAVRNLIKNKAFTLINIAGLTVCLTACLYIALLLRHETSYDKFHPDADRIYRILVNYTTPDRNISMGYCDALAGPEIKAGSLEMELIEWYGSAALMAVNDLHKKLQKKGITE